MARITLFLLVALVLRGIFPPEELPWLPIPVLVGAAIALGLLGALLHRREPPEAKLLRDPGLFVLLTALAVLLGILLSHRMRITSDGVDHYVYLRSLWVDHDLDLANDYAAVAPGGQAAESLTPIGRTANTHPVGPAIVWSPFYLLADILSRATGRPPDGLNVLYKNAVAIASVLYGWLGLVLLYDTARRETARGPALLAALGIGFGTFLYWYLAFAPTMAHAPAFGAAALVVWLWLRPGAPSLGRAAAIGAACGLAALLHWADGLLLLLPLVGALPRFAVKQERPRVLGEAIVMALAALVVFSPQMVVWKQLYGEWLTIPQSRSYVANAPRYDGVLFSPRHGLFSWSPLLYLGVVGLVLFAWRDRWRGAAVLLFCAVMTRVNAGVFDWWGGAAFGGRRFDAVLPLAGLGLAFALAGLARLAASRPGLVPAAVLAGFVIWNLLLARQYRSGVWDYSEGVTFEEMGRGAVSLVDRNLGSPFSLPGSLLLWWRTGVAPSDYESQFMERPHSRWSIRMGLDERLFLEDGWSPPADQDGTTCRTVVGASAGIVVPLHRPQPYRLGARLAAPPGSSGMRVAVFVNQRPVGTWDVLTGWKDYELSVGAELLRPGRNFLRLRVAGEGARNLAVAGVWMEP